MMEGWDDKRTWKKRGTNFLIEVSCHTVKQIDEPCCFDSEGPYRWCIYAYIYPKHPIFTRFDLDNIYQDETARMPFHGGCTYIRHHLTMDENVSVSAVQVGCDYHHLYDDIYTVVSPDDADNQDYFQVWKDADELFVYLEERNND